MKFYFAVFFILTYLTNSFALEKVSLQLKWFHQFQFAGYYAAKEKGFYNDVGLDVEIKERDVKFNNIEQVINNESQYGIADSVLILYKAQQQSVVLISPIFQHSPSAFITLKNSGINSPYQLEGKNVIFYPNDTDGFALLAMLKKLDIKPNLIRKREKNDYIKLLDDDVDILSSYLSNEPFYFKKQDIDINIINPSNYGFDLYGDILFTNANEAKNNPERVQRFKEATLKGWKYALDNKEEIIQLIYNKYNSSKSIEHLRYESKAVEQLISNNITPIGTIDKGRIQFISSLYNEFGQSTKNFDIKNFIFEEYRDNEKLINLTQNEKEYLKNNPIIKVHNFQSFPPYNFNNNGKAMGYTIDYLNKISKILDIKIEYVSDKTWKESLDLIKTNEINILPNVAMNKERKEFIDYSSFIHIHYQTSLAIRTDTDIKSFNDIKDKTLAVLNKSFLHTIIKKSYPNQSLYLAPTIKDAVLAVSNGKADVVIDNLATLEYYINNNWLSNVKTLKLPTIETIPSYAPLYMGVAKENTVLKSILDKAYKVIPHNEIIDLKKKWLNHETEQKVKFSDEEYRYLKSKAKLNMCIDPNWMPFEQIKNKKHIGMTSEYINIFEKSLPIPIQLNETKNWLDTISKAKSRQCDFITIMMGTEERKKYFNFTKPLMNMSIVIATKIDKSFISNIENVIDKKFAMVKGFAYKEILKSKYPEIEIIEVNDADDGLQKVNENKVYGFIGVLPVIGFNIQENYVGSLKINGKIDGSIGLPMATRNDEPLLNSILNKLILSITDEENRQISNKWLSIQYEENIDYKTIIYIIIIFIIILITIAIKNRDINKVNNKLSKYVKVVDEHVLTSTTDLEGNITYVSQAFCEVSGYSKEELLGNNHRIIKHEDMTEEFFGTLWERILSGKRWVGEIKNKKKNGQYYWVNASISPLFNQLNEIVGYTAIRHEITDKKKIEEISITDELTTLYNKRHFNQIFKNELDRAKRDEYYFALIILDVDFFKQYNDFYGHQEGDNVLEKIGTKLKEVCKRPSDIPFRIGGEEFGIIFLPKSEDDAIEFCKIINDAIESLRIEHKYNKASHFITASIGLYTKKGKKLDSMKEIYSFTDTALYQSKSNGRNTYTLYDKNIEILQDNKYEDIYYI